MTITAAAISFHNGGLRVSGREGFLFIILILSFVTAKPVFSFGLVPEQRAFALYLSSRGGLLPPLFATTEGTGSKDNSKEAVTPEQKSSKKEKPTKETPIFSHLANDANLSKLTENNPTWDQNIAALLEYNATYGTVNLPERSKEYPNLGRWVKNLRQREGSLTEEQRQQLNDIGFIWKEANKNKRDMAWDDMVSRLEKYKGEYGDCLVPITYDLDPKLARWVAKQRRDNTQGKIKPKRKDTLDSIGFAWRLKEFSKRDRQDLEDLWEKRYQELIEFKEEHNHTNVPYHYPPNQGLGRWVNRQREYKKNGVLQKDRIPQLDKLGFIWDFEPIWDESWLKCYEDLKTYYQNLAIYKKMKDTGPRDGSSDQKKPFLGEELSHWKHEQCRLHAKGALDPDRKAMLDDIGFDWWEVKGPS